MKMKKEIKEKASAAGVIRSGKFDHIFFLSLLFIITALYFIFFGSHIFYYQENQSLFIYSADYFRQFTVKPGGIIEYAASFIIQGFHNTISGSFILSALITLIAMVFYKISRKIYYEGPLLMLFMVLPSCILILFHSNFNFHPVNTIGFLLVSVCFVVLINAERKPVVFFILALFPLFYYVAGAYAWIVGGMYIIYSLLNRKIINAVFILVLSFITFIVFKEIVFFQPLNILLFNPMPPKDLFGHPVLFNILYGLFVLYPLILKITSLLKIKETNIRSLSVYFVLFTLVLTIFSLSRLFKSEVENLFKLEKLFCRQEWEGAIKFQEKMKMRNVVAQYYYNIALSEKDLLCDRLFNSDQDYGTGSIMVQWDSKSNINQIFRGAYFFYTIGLVNEAHRWAFESMVVQGFRPENIKMLIKTELISGHYKIAKKYIDVLKKTLNYRGLAKKYEKMLYARDLVESDPELGPKIKLLPGKDFLIRLQDQQDNVLLMLESNRGNRKAFEYMMAWFMLERNVENVCNKIAVMKGMGYNRIPRHIEEAAVWFRSYTGKLPDMGGFTVSNETMKRLSGFRSAAAQPDPGKEKLKKMYGNTLWYYMEF
jgi:hypothetical protein